MVLVDIRPALVNGGLALVLYVSGAELPVTVETPEVTGEKIGGEVEIGTRIREVSWAMRGVRMRAEERNRARATTQKEVKSSRVGIICVLGMCSAGSALGVFIRQGGRECTRSVKTECCPVVSKCN